jgi:hypothetical protein
MASKHGRKPPNPIHVPHSHGKRPPAPQPHRSRPAGHPGRPGQGKDACCPMVAALRSARRGKFRLARRYATWSVRLIAARLA